MILNIVYKKVKQAFVYSSVELNIKGVYVRD